MVLAALRASSVSDTRQNGTRGIDRDQLFDAGCIAKDLCPASFHAVSSSFHMLGVRIQYDGNAASG